MGRFVDAQGQVVDQALDARTIGLEFDDLRRAERAIAVASGTEKQKIVLAALRAGVVKTLITDAGIAAYVLEHENDN